MPKTAPARGSAGPGVPFDPTGQAEESVYPGEAKTRPAPAPGVPMPEATFEKLKRDAETARRPPSRHSQEDPAAKK